ncbi:uncharacterized protein LOC121252111 [Juglans microcarpa x Juglans regia]|uniref:uncharacterized protein LOC121252111 n=1 Tax=Juglans microcarpa x Juglans regia TaxID=2249226 RepID=UPI001B7E3502|nr:uncharacterized protein LOC121252111 [Juglans microcarpa x Juglans regia]
MALVQRFGKPDIFLTMTCNPSWKEILDELGPQEEAQNRPDLIARIFRAKLEELKDELFKREIFGKVSAYVYVIEHQKRGLPHAHFLIILQRDWKIYAPESFDEIVSAEISDKERNLHLHKTVIRHMMHGPCGVLNPSNVCMKTNGSCKNHFPKGFASNTTVGIDCFPQYRRCDNGITVKVRGKNLDNRWVVPHNLYLLAKFDCHLNVEICSTIKAVKYLYKYIYKGHDRVAFNLIPGQNIQDIDEIQQFQSARWIAPPEAMWRIYGFILNEMYPSVYSLHLHLEDQHLVAFHAHNDLNNVLRYDFTAKSMLTEFFSTNQANDNARRLLYKEFPEAFVWNQQHKIWTPRKKKTVIGRIVTASPFEGERYYLRILLNHIRGHLSFDHIKTVGNVTAPTFREAATLHGLLQRDTSLQDCMQEASLYQIPHSLRRLFATILIYCNPTNPRELWEYFEQDMSSDFQTSVATSADIRTKVLRSISSTLESMGKDINIFHLIEHDVSFDQNETESREINDEFAVLIPEEDLMASMSLNPEQQHAYESILQKVLLNESAAFFIDGPGGTGKTFLYKALLATVRSRNLIALATASSGIAASILPGGRTAHSRFKIPLDLDKNSTCCVSKQGALAKLLRLAKLIIWDEAPMSRKECMQALDKMLRDITDSRLPFGRKIIVFGGDFRQVLPVIRKGTRQEEVNASLASSYLWSTLTKISLSENMQARFDPNFSNYLLQVGNGTTPITIENKIKILSEMLIPYKNDVESLDDLIDAVFQDIGSYSENLSEMTNRAILTPNNNSVDEINTILIQRFPGTVTQYYSFDETIDTSEQGIMEDFLNTLTPNGLPPHELLLKKNCPIMLLRNVNPSEGLCNGTRLICHNFERNIIDAEIAVGHHTGKRVFIQRIPFLPNADDNSGFNMRTVYTSIKNITPSTRNWSIKMIVSDKSPKRTAQHSPTKYQNLTLIDPEGNRLQATIFGKDIDLRNDMLHIFRSYYISNAYVKPLDPKHRIEAHEYQWILNSRTIIENIPDDEVELQPPEYDIIPFTNLHDYKNTGTEIGLSLSSQPTSVFTLNPVIPAATPLCQWTMLNHALLEEIVEKNLHHTMASASASTSNVDMKDIIKLDDVAGFLKSLQPMTKAKFWIKATICVVDLHQIFFYMSCIGCKKGTGYEQNEKFQCYHCKYMSNAQPRCRAYIEVDDGNGRLGAVMFGQIA